jgi:hypothetical protein
MSRSWLAAGRKSIRDTCSLRGNVASEYSRGDSFRDVAQLLSERRRRTVVYQTAVSRHPAHARAPHCDHALPCPCRPSCRVIHPRPPGESRLRRLILGDIRQHPTTGRSIKRAVPDLGARIVPNFARSLFDSRRSGSWRPNYSIIFFDQDRHRDLS